MLTPLTMERAFAYSFLLRFGLTVSGEIHQTEQ
jgi:hypothetical protein